MKFNHTVKSCLLLLCVNIAHAGQQLDWQGYTVKHGKGDNRQTAEGELAYFEVPSNRKSGKGDKLKLGFVRLPSTAARPGNPIVYLSGGPGGSATGTAQGPRFKLFMQMREVADVILFDQRGTGLSRNGLKNCSYPSQVPMDQAYTRELLAGEIEASTRYCVKQWQAQNVDLNAYNTRESAADLETLRKTLGVEKIDLWGISYGTHLAMATAKYYPKSIGRMVLASSEGLDHTVKLPGLSDNHLARVAAEIAKDPQSAKKYPDLPGLMRQVLEKLDKQPVIIDVDDPLSGKSDKMAVGSLEVQLLTALILTKDPQYIAYLPATFAMMARGDFSEVAQYLAYLRHSMWQLNPMSTAMDAASGISAARWQKVLEQSRSSILWRAHNLPFPDANRYAGIEDLGDEFRQMPNSDIPTLFLAGTLDGRTFIESQKAIAGHFSDKTFVTIERGGHNLFLSSPGVAEKMMAFYRGHKLADEVITLPPVKFL